jgi:hypothetical protein
MLSLAFRIATALAFFGLLLPFVAFAAGIALAAFLLQPADSTQNPS